MGNIFIGIFIPFIGTILGAGCVFFLKNSLNQKMQKALLGFASGVMVAASVWSLLIPALNNLDKIGLICLSRPNYSQKLSFANSWDGVLLLLYRFYRFKNQEQISLESRTMVKGPSLISSTCISAPKLPVSTTESSCFAFAIMYSYNWFA